MNDLTLEETISMLYGMLFIGGFSATETDIIKAAIRHLEDKEERNNEQ